MPYTMEESYNFMDTLPIFGPNSGGTLFRQIKKVYAILDSLVKSQNLELLRQLVGIVKVVNTHIYCGY